MIRPRFILDLPNTDDPSRFVPLVLALESLAKIDEFHFQRGVASGTPYPRLYDSGVYYREEKPGKEDWPDVPNVLAQGWGDCEDLAAYRAAELRQYDGIMAMPVIKWRKISAAEMLKQGYPKKSIPPDGVYLVHCLVRYPNGTIEDPSKILGMKGEYS